MKWRSLEESTPQSEARSLRNVYVERKALIAKYVPAAIQAVHARVVDELRQSGIARHVLKTGDPAPSFELQDHNGKLVCSAKLLEHGPLVVCFFRGRWCPFCIAQMEAMNAIFPRLQELGASLVGASPQTVHQSYLMVDQHKLRFPLLSDAGNQVARQFRVVYRVPEYQQEIYSRAFINLPFMNGDSNWDLPIPATYVMGRDWRQRPAAPQNLILYASANPDYTDRPEPAEVLQSCSTASVRDVQQS
jgi:peroxiredoxin